jgi:hypothetical protein
VRLAQRIIEEVSGHICYGGPGPRLPLLRTFSTSPRSCHPHEQQEGQRDHPAAPISEGSAFLGVTLHGGKAGIVGDSLVASLMVLSSAWRVRCDRSFSSLRGGAAAGQTGSTAAGSC